MAPPYSWVLDFHAALKDAGALTCGEPPYGHAERSSRDTFAQKVGIDAPVARQRLEKAGFRVTGGGQILQAMASVNQTTPKALYEAMRGAGAATPLAGGLPDTAPPGTGRLTLAELCSQYDLDVQPVLKAL